MPKTFGNVRSNPYGTVANRPTIPLQRNPQAIPMQPRPPRNVNVQTGRLGLGQNVVYHQPPTIFVPQPPIYVSQPVVPMAIKTLVYTNAQPQRLYVRNYTSVDDGSNNCTACGILSLLLAVAAVALVILGVLLLAVLL